MVNSKNKGDCNEREAARALTEWAGHEFVRIPLSGGLRWDNRVNVCGDLISTDPEFDFPFSVETKHYRSLGLKKGVHLLRSNSVIFTFMAQCKRDAETAGKNPFLMLRENGMKQGTWYIFLPVNFSQQLTFNNYLAIRFMDKEGTIAGFPSESFFKNIRFETLKWIYK